jgi:hypothetical protein
MHEEKHNFIFIIKDSVFDGSGKLFSTPKVAKLVVTE